MNTHLKHFAVLAIGISFLLGIYAEVDACTRVFWNTLSDLKIVARNEDYLTPVDPTMVITPRGIERVGSKEDNAVRWTSKYGNVCMYANNRFPMDGLNEKGLTARTLFFTQGKEVDAAHPDRPALDSDHWTSYILDNFATVKAAVTSIRNNVRLKVIHDHYEYASGKHIAMADVSGDSAIIEIQDGKVAIFHGPQYRVLTNPPNYQTMLKAVADHKGMGLMDVPGSLNAKDRFVRASYHLGNLPKQPKDRFAAYGYANTVLASVVFPIGAPVPDEDKKLADMIKKEAAHPEKMLGTATYWQSISDLTNLHYRFKSAAAPSDVYVNLSEIDFSKSQGVRGIHMLDEHAQRGQFGNLIHDFVPIQGDIYDMQPD